MTQRARETTELRTGETDRVAVVFETRGSGEVVSLTGDPPTQAFVYGAELVAAAIQNFAESHLGKDEPTTALLQMGETVVAIGKTPERLFVRIDPSSSNTGLSLLRLRQMMSPEQSPVDSASGPPSVIESSSVARATEEEG